MEAQKGGRNIIMLLLWLVCLMEIVGQCCDPAAWLRKRDQVPILRQAQWAQGPVSKGVEDFSLTTNTLPNRLSLR
jgi:hypothetical protein